MKRYLNIFGLYAFYRHSDIEDQKKQQIITNAVHVTALH